MTLFISLNDQFSQFKHMIWIRYRFVRFGNHWILFLFPMGLLGVLIYSKFIYKKKGNKTQTNNKCLNNWVIMSQLQLALAMTPQVSGSLLQEWNTIPSKIHSLICFSDDGFREHYLHRLSAKTWEFATTVIVFKPFSDISRPLDGSTVILEDETLMKANLWEPKCLDFYLKFLMTLLHMQKYVHFLN